MASKVRPGKIWRMTTGGMPASVFLVPDATNVPVGGDLCDYSSGKPEYKASTPGSATTEDKTLRYICLEGRKEIDLLNNPGNTAGTNDAPGRVRIGANRSRVPDATSKLKPFMPIITGFEWVMPKKTGTTVAIGSQYGIDRIGAGDYVIDGGDTQAVVEVIGYYEPDYLANGASFDQYWVKAVSPGGYA